MKYRIASFIVYHALRFLARTLRLRVIGEEHVLAAQREGKGVVEVTWHGRTLIPITSFQGRGYWAIISTSRDGEYQNCIFQRFGFQTVRGSTSARGAVKAALMMTRQLKSGAILAFTPDGPRGPSHEVQHGAIFMAQKSGCPIIPAGISASPRTLLKSWDSYLIPHPFARAVLIFGEPIYIPADANDEEQAQWAIRVGAAIDALELQAEAEVGILHVRTSPQDAKKNWRRA